MHVLHMRVSAGHMVCLSAIRWGRATDVFIYSWVKSLSHTCWQTCSDYRDFPKGSIAALHRPSIDPKLTLKERWNPVTSVILFCTILFRLGGCWYPWWKCGGDSGFFLGLSICTSPKQKVVPERVASDHTALGWWVCCGALNGSPADNTIHKPLCYRPQIQIINRQDSSLFGKSFIEPITRLPNGRHRLS